MEKEARVSGLNIFDRLVSCERITPAAACSLSCLSRTNARRRGEIRSLANDEIDEIDL